MAATIDTVKRGKQLGAGAFGTVYAATHGGREYALKIEKIALADIPRQIAIKRLFQRSVAAKHPAMFMQLYDIRHEPHCDHVQVPDKKWGSPGAEQKRLAKSKHCIVRLYSRAGPDMATLFRGPNATPMDPIIQTNHKKIYSAIAQIIGMCAAMAAAKFHHDDLHMWNIATRRTTKKTIDILGRRIPTFGVIFSAIDYGLIDHPKFKPSKHNKKLRRDGAEDIDITITDLATSSVWPYVRKHKIRMDYNKDMAKFKALRGYQYIRDMAPTGLWLYTFNILHPQAFYAMVLPQLSPAIRAKFTVIFHIPREHILAFITMSRDLPRALDYFAALMK